MARCGVQWRKISIIFTGNREPIFLLFAHQTDPSGADAQAKYRKPLFLSDGGVVVGVGERGLGRAF